MEEERRRLEAAYGLDDSSDDESNVIAPPVVRASTLGGLPDARPPPPPGEPTPRGPAQHHTLGAPAPPPDERAPSVVRSGTLPNIAPPPLVSNSNSNHNNSSNNNAASIQTPNNNNNNNSNQNNASDKPSNVGLAASTAGLPSFVPPPIAAPLNQSVSAARPSASPAASPALSRRADSGDIDIKPMRAAPPAPLVPGSPSIDAAGAPPPQAPVAVPAATPTPAPAPTKSAQELAMEKMQAAQLAFEKTRQQETAAVEKDKKGLFKRFRSRGKNKGDDSALGGEISGPTNVQHTGHVGFDSKNGGFVCVCHCCPFSLFF